MNPYGSFQKFEEDLYRIESESFQIPITIGILICNAEDPDCKEILCNMGQFDKMSSDYINFYIPGYCSVNQMNSLENSDFYKPLYEIRGEKYYFSNKFFGEFLKQLEERHNIVYDGEPELILVEVIDGRIHWDRKIRFALFSLEKDGNIKSVYHLFSQIFEDARKYVAIDDFSRQGRRRQLQKSFYEIIKDRIPKELLTLYENDKIFRISDSQ